MSPNVAISHVYGYNSKTVSDKISFLTSEGFCVLGPQKISNHFSQISINESRNHLFFKKTFGNPRSGTKFLFFSKKLLLNKKTQSILVESEPWSLVFLQILLYRKLFAPQASLTLFTWENFIRKGLKGRLLKVFYRLAIRNCKKIICGNHAGKQIFDMFGARPEQLHISTQFGINPQDFKSLPETEKKILKEKYLGVDKEKFIIGFAGRLVEEKGILELKDAFQRLRATNENIHLFILGNGPLKEKISSINGITLIEAVGQNEVPNYLNIMDLFVLPSKTTHFWIEQFGRVLIEAMACGIPVIGSDSGEIPYVIGNNKCIFKEGNSDGIFELLKKFTADREFYSTIKSEQQERVKTFHNEKVYQSLVQIIKESIQ